MTRKLKWYTRKYPHNSKEGSSRGAKKQQQQKHRIYRKQIEKWQM